MFLQPWVKVGHSRWMRLDDVVGPRFVLAVMDGDILANCGPHIWRRWRELGGCIVSLGGDCPPSIQEIAWFDVRERDGLLMRWLSSGGHAALIARPDRYVYGTAGSAKAIAALITELNSAVLKKSDTSAESDFKLA